MLFTPSGMDMDVRDEQEEKADFPMLVTPSGIDMDVREEQS